MRLVVREAARSVRGGFPTARDALPARTARWPDGAQFRRIRRSVLRHRADRRRGRSAQPSLRKPGNRVLHHGCTCRSHRRVARVQRNRSRGARHARSSPGADRDRPRRTKSAARRRLRERARDRARPRPRGEPSPPSVHLGVDRRTEARRPDTCPPPLRARAPRGRFRARRTRSLRRRCALLPRQRSRSNDAELDVRRRDPLPRPDAQPPSAALPDHTREADVLRGRAADVRPPRRYLLARRGRSLDIAHRLLLQRAAPRGGQPSLSRPLRDPGKPALRLDRDRDNQRQPRAAGRASGIGRSATSRSTRRRPRRWPRPAPARPAKAR